MIDTLAGVFAAAAQADLYRRRRWRAAHTDVGGDKPTPIPAESETVVCRASSEADKQLIDGRSFHGFNHDHVDRTAGGLELQPELLLKRGEP